MLAFVLSPILRRAIMTLTLSACASLASAQSYHVEIDTSGFGSSGWLELQFNSAGNAAAAFATVSDMSGAFDSGGVSGLTPQISGDVSGSLASGYQFDNGGGFNDLFHAVNFGGMISFDVSFSGGVYPSANVLQSMFSVAAYGADQASLLGHPDSASGSLVIFLWTPAGAAGQNGTVTASVFDATRVAVAAVPEASEWLMLLAGAGPVAFCLRRRRLPGALRAA
ncbi:MAG TPA: NF038129 family PEP-CTERM protein [Janthinobacterium sp.]|nr:NF038129 family PEP-CTERM protein [Janthinobacterium sp.]